METSPDEKPVDSIWHTTCSALRAGDEPSWQDAWGYRQPLLLLIASRYRWVSESDREDLVEDILLDVKKHLFKRYLPDRGKFRAYLCGVVRNRVLALHRARRALPLEAVPEPEELPADEALAIDLVAEVLGAAREWCEQKRVERPEHVAVLADRLLGKKTLKEIASAHGMPISSAHAVVSAARQEIVARLLEHTFPARREGLAGLDWKALAERALRALARPRRQREEVARVAHPATRRDLETWLETMRGAIARLPGRTSAAGKDLCEGLEAILFEVVPAA